MTTIQKRIGLSGAALLAIIKNKLDSSAPLQLEKVVEVLYGCKFDTITSPVLHFKKCKSIYSYFEITPTPDFIESMASIILSNYPDIEPPEDELTIVTSDEDDEDEE